MQVLLDPEAGGPVSLARAWLGGKPSRNLASGICSAVSGSWGLWMSSALAMLAANGLAVTLLAFASPGHAQESGHACANVVGPVQRLACYDRAFPPPSQVHQAQAKQARDEFGREHPVQAREPLVEPLPEIQATLARVDYRGNQAVFTLDDGQVWVQTESVLSGSASPGQRVRVRKAMLGSHMLVLPSGVAVRVKRVR
ncbi:MAG: hypothetical protein QM581_11960 [Pseudomonas sp.]